MAHGLDWPEKQTGSLAFLDWVSLPKIFTIFVTFFLASLWTSSLAYVPFFPVWARISVWSVSFLLTLLLLSWGEDRLCQSGFFKKLFLTILLWPVFLTACLSLLALVNAWTGQQEVWASNAKVLTADSTIFVGRVGFEPGVCVTLQPQRPPEDWPTMPDEIGPLCFPTQEPLALNSSLRLEFRQGGLGFAWVARPKP